MEHGASLGIENQVCFFRFLKKAEDYININLGCGHFGLISNTYQLSSIAKSLKVPYSKSTSAPVWDYIVNKNRYRMQMPLMGIRASKSGDSDATCINIRK